MTTAQTTAHPYPHRLRPGSRWRTAAERCASGLAAAPTRRASARPGGRAVLHPQRQLDVLRTSITTAAGDLLVVPPGLAHAFGAHRGSAAEALIVITPGVERFEYFRHVVRMRAGTEPREILLALQDRFDTHFVESPAWPAARAS